MHKSIFIGLFALSPFLFSFGPCQSMAQEQEEPQHMSYSCITVPASKHEDNYQKLFTYIPAFPHCQPAEHHRAEHCLCLVLCHHDTGGL